MLDRGSLPPSHVGQIHRHTATGASREGPPPKGEIMKTAKRAELLARQLAPSIKSVMDDNPIEDQKRYDKLKRAYDKANDVIELLMGVK